jgi:hypothetical protein
MAVFWGMFAYSLAVLGMVVSLAVKLALLFKERGELRRKLDESARQVAAAVDAAAGCKATIARYHKEIKVLQDELDQVDDDLGVDGVADRLERLLSGEVLENDDKDPEGGDPMPAPNGTEENGGGS